MKPLAAHLFGRHVGRRSEDEARFRFAQRHRRDGGFGDNRLGELRQADEASRLRSLGQKW